MIRRLGGSVVVVDKDGQKLRELPDDFLYVVGDALEDEILVRAGIHRARSLLSTFSDDTLNVYLVLEARDIRPDIDVVSTASGRESSRRLYLAGATRVVSPQVMGAEVLAKSAYNPSVYQLMSDMISGTTPGETITQVLVGAGSPLAGSTLGKFKELKVRARVMLIRTGTSTTLSPAENTRLEPGAVLVVIGERSELEKLEQLASS